MAERLARKLGPDARQALGLAATLAGHEPVLRRVKSLPNGTRAMLVRPRVAGQSYEIHVVKGQRSVLDHLVAHEVGHLVRLHEVPEAERLTPISSRDTRYRAAEQVVRQLERLLERGIPHGALPELFDLWYQGVITQLTSFPADLRIERWIHEEFPGLRQVQRRSLLLEVSRGLPSLRPQVEALTPTTIYRATMAMNAAQAHHVAELYSLPLLTKPFERNGFGSAGRELASVVLDRDDDGHRSDMRAVNQWASRLRLSGWFEWRLMDASRPSSNASYGSSATERRSHPPGGSHTAT